MNKLRDVLLIIFVIILTPFVTASLVDALGTVEAQTPPGQPCLIMPEAPLITEWNEARLWMAAGRPGEITVLRYDTLQTIIIQPAGVPISLTWEGDNQAVLHIGLNTGFEILWNLDTGEQIVNSPYVPTSTPYPTGTPDEGGGTGEEGGNIGAGGLDTPTPTCVPEKKVSMAYTNEKKAIAVAIVDRHGGKVSVAALEEIRGVIDEPNLPAKTVRRWLLEVNKSSKAQNVPEMSALKKPEMSPAVQSALQKADGALDRVFEEITRVYAQKVLDAALREEIKAKDAMTIAAISYDKHRLAAGLPTEIIRILPILIQKIEASGMSPHELFNDMIAELDAETRAQMKQATIEDDSSQ